MPDHDPPWQRIREIAEIPSPVTVSALRDLDDEHFARLIRDHAIPRSQDTQERQRWDSLWRTLAGDDTLADRAFDELEDYLDTVDAALADGGLDVHQLKRARKFRENCAAAWKRLEGSGEGRPLQWAGKAGRGFTPVGERVINTLVQAIAQHRRDDVIADDVDERLWSVLRTVGLDPADFEVK